MPKRFSMTNDVEGGCFLGQNTADHVAVDVGEPARCAVVVIGEPFVVEAEQVEDRRVEVVNVDDVFDGLVAEFVGGAEAEPVLDAGAGEPGGEALGVMVAARRSLSETWACGRTRWSRRRGCRRAVRGP